MKTPANPQIETFRRISRPDDREAIRRWAGKAADMIARRENPGPAKIQELVELVATQCYRLGYSQGEIDTLKLSRRR